MREADSWRVAADSCRAAGIKGGEREHQLQSACEQQQQTVNRLRELDELEGSYSSSKQVQ